MATIVPFKSEWEWVNIARGLDYSAQNGVSTKRNNWVLTRSRISNDSYASQLDETLFSLTAYNGGVPERIDGITGIPVEGLFFDNSTTWTANTTPWVPFDFNAQTQYRYQPSGAANIPSASHVNQCYFNRLDNTNVIFGWFVLEVPIAIASNTFRQPYSSYLNGIRNSTIYTEVDLANGTFPQTPEGLLFDTAKGTFVGSATPSITITSERGNFLCTGDAQSYQQRGVDWYTQTQTWSFKDSWRGV